jgi:hypothetical protein
MSRFSPPGEGNMSDFPHITCAVFAVRAEPAGAHHLRVAGSAPGDRQLSSAIAAALDDMCQDLERFHARQEQRLQLARSIAAADALIEELEGLSLAGEVAVPVAWQPRLDRFAGGLPREASAELRCGGEPDQLLEQVFEIEERLFRLKLGEWALRFDATAPESRSQSG